MAEVTLEGLQEEWPGWKLWRTETMWNATRRGPKPVAPEGFFSSLGYLAITLIEDGPHELLAALQDQASLEAQIEAAAHVGEHPVGPACPLSCLGLTVGTDSALRDYWLPAGKVEPTVGDLLDLRENGALSEVPYIKSARTAEIEHRLEALHVGEAA